MCVIHAFRCISRNNNIPLPSRRILGFPSFFKTLPLALEPPIRSRRRPIAPALSPPHLDPPLLPRTLSRTSTPTSFLPFLLLYSPCGIVSHHRNSFRQSIKYNHHKNARPSCFPFIPHLECALQDIGTPPGRCRDTFQGGAK